MGCNPDFLAMRGSCYNLLSESSLTAGTIGSYSFAAGMFDKRDPVKMMA